jgi:hypothetical protein
VQDGAIIEDSRRLLDALFNNRPPWTAAALPGVCWHSAPDFPSPAGRLRYLADANVQASLLNLAATGDEAVGAGTAQFAAHTPAKSAIGTPTSLGLRFRPLREHAWGVARPRWPRTRKRSACTSRPRYTSPALHKM